MGQLTSDQRHVLYVQEATRSGVHKAILAALYQVQAKPLLIDGETGLGIAPVHQMTLDQVDTFAAQVQYAANTIRSLTNSLTLEGWNSEALWHAEQGRYTDKFVQAIASGYTAPSSEPAAALLEASNATALLQAYINDLTTEAQAAQLPPTFLYLDAALLAFVKSLPHCYFSLPYQRHALLESVRLWCKLDTREAAIASLHSETTLVEPTAIAANPTDEAIDAALLHFVPLMVSHYAGYPQQREALLRLTQLWQQLESREAAIAALAQNVSPTLNFNIDAALMAIVQRLPQTYEGNGTQRNALVETFRLWQQLESRSETLIALGVDPAIFTATTPNQADITNAAVQLDHALLNFIRRLPTLYESTPVQRDALLHLTQLWRSLHTPEQALQSLLHNLKQMAVARRDTPEAPPIPAPLLLSTRPDRWTHDTLQLDAAIVPNGSFTWADATSGGTQLPSNQASVDAIVQLAQLIQQVRDRLNRPLQITIWYVADSNTSSTGILSRQHHLGDALTFYCEGLTSTQLYWFLDPWWTGGLGRYAAFPYLCSVNARSDRARWLR